MRKILSIEYNIPGFSESYERYSSNKSLLDSDMVIFRPYMNSYSYDYYDGKPSYNESSSRNFREAEKHWNSEISEYLKSGKVLFVVLDKLDQFYIKTGDKQYSGTGRSRHTLNIINERSNYDLISKSDIIVNSEGDIIRCNNKIFSDFFNEFKSWLFYRVYLKSESIEQGFTTKHGDRIIGGIENAGNGKIVYLPMLDFEVEEFIEEDEKGKGIWNKEAIKYGKRFIQNLINIEKQILGKTTKSVQPEWLDNEKFQLNKVQKLREGINKINQQINELSKKSDSLKNKFAKENELKDLLFETGKPLETAVIKGLTILGYKAENYDDGELELDQVITSPENDRFIGECEGKDNKAIDISKLRQLADAINEDFEKNDVSKEAYGLLFGNPQRILIPDKRTETFTEKCKSAANRRRIGLILTSDLFVVCQYIMNHKDSSFKKKCRTAIKKGLGGIIEFPKITKKNDS